MSELFKQIDINHDGFISTLELQKTLASQGRRTSFEETKKLIEIIDLDQNGKINYTEFVSSLLENSVIFR
jgi:Ca2+-binding EF-hand superfamily protein